jgi:radical SAM superfamily enzyme YgiQ (UPF0313 family)
MLINPPSPYLKNDASYPPSGLLYLAGKIEQLGEEVVISDMSGGHPLAKTSDVDMIGITCTTPNIGIVNKLFPTLPDVPILLGGPHPTFVSDVFPGMIPVKGEADNTIQKIIIDYKLNMLKDSYTSDVPRICDIAMPARHLVGLHRYTPGGWKKSTVVYTSRGCPYSCRFCSKTHGQNYRRFPIERIRKEIEQCIRYGFKRIVFGDDNLIATQPQMESFFSMVEDYCIEYRLNQDARRLEKHTAERAVQSGCVDISFGIESGSQKMLDLMNKQTTVERNAETLAIAKKAGLKTKTYLIVNFPGETKKTIDETLKFVKSTQPDEVLVSQFAPLPGSYVWNNPKEFGILTMTSNWDDYYLVGKEQTTTFTTKALSKRTQESNRNRLKDGLRECGY